MKNSISDEMKKRLYVSMLRIRRLEEKVIELYPQQEMHTPVHLCIGEEAIAAGICASLKKDDYVFGTHRGHGLYLAKGGDMKRLAAEFYGKKTGCAKGKGGSMHLVDPEMGVCGTTAIVGGNIPLATGVALSFSLQKTDQVAVCFFGDGAVDEGTFHESLNFASLKKLPVVFICENNFYATHSPRFNRQSYAHIYKLAENYNIPGVCVDGNNVLKVYTEGKKAVECAREKKGPSFIECKTYRWKAHVGPEPDTGTGYRTRKELDRWIKRCPVKLLRERLYRENILTESENQKISRKIDKEIQDAFIYAKNSPYPEESELFEDVLR
jgi:acetoin:2,6-dichlorophenolindophenol oxidoreductase subunit alpha